MLADVRVRPVVELAGRREGVVAEDEPELAADLAIAGLALLPAGAADRPDDRVDLLDHVLDDRRRARWRVFGEDLGEGAAVRIENLELIEPAVRLRPLRADELAGEFEQSLEELDRVLRAFEAGENDGLIWPTVMGITALSGWGQL